MARDLQLNDEVFVPRSAVGEETDGPGGPFFKTFVREFHDRSAKVDAPNGGLSDWIGTSRIRVMSELGVLIVRIGDFNELGLLDPLLKSILHSVRLLVPHDNVQAIELRTMREFLYFWTEKHNTCFQVVLIGHGDSHHVHFGHKKISAKVLRQLFERPQPTAKEVISLCCNTGQASFAREFSRSSSVRAFVAPYHSIHGITASQFCQAYLTRRLLMGRTIGVAFNQARRLLLDAASFRLWQTGGLNKMH